MSKSRKRPKKIKPHKSKYSNCTIGNKDKSKLEWMLNQLLNSEDFKLTSDYNKLNQIKEKNSRDYYNAVRIAYYKYLN